MAWLASYVYDVTQEQPLEQKCVSTIRSTLWRNKRRSSVAATSIGVARGAMPPKILENIDILCFERRFSKQNSVIRLKSSILGWNLQTAQEVTKSLIPNLNHSRTGFAG